MDNNKPQLIDLWRTSFDDSEEFIKLFFDRVYKKENALFIEKDGKIVSALQMLPYVMTYYGKEISVNYIYGACTLPSERGQDSCNPIHISILHHDPVRPIHK